MRCCRSAPSSAASRARMGVGAGARPTSARRSARSRPTRRAHRSKCWRAPASPKSRRAPRAAAMRPPGRHSRKNAGRAMVVGHGRDPGRDRGRRLCPDRHAGAAAIGRPRSATPRRSAFTMDMIYARRGGAAAEGELRRRRRRQIGKLPAGVQRDVRRALRTTPIKGAAAADLENARLGRAAGRARHRRYSRRGRAVQGEAISALAEGGGASPAAAPGPHLPEFARNRICGAERHLHRRAVRRAATASAPSRSARRRERADRRDPAAPGAAAVTGIPTPAEQSRRGRRLPGPLQRYFPGGQRLPMPPPPPSYSRSGG
jgi:hypothetical protein